MRSMKVSKSSKSSFNLEQAHGRNSADRSVKAPSGVRARACRTPDGV